MIFSFFYNIHIYEDEEKKKLRRKKVRNLIKFHHIHMYTQNHYDIIKVSYFTFSMLTLITSGD